MTNDHGEADRILVMASNEWIDPSKSPQTIHPEGITTNTPEYDQDVVTGKKNDVKSLPHKKEKKKDQKNG